MSESIDLTKTRRTMEDVIWNSTNFGALEEIKPKIELALDPIKVGSMGKVKLGDRYTGLTDGSMVTVILCETGSLRAVLQKLLPWATQTTGAELALTPALNVDLYTYAQQLTIHPRDLGTTTDQDRVLLKTVPTNAVNLGRNGQNDDRWAIDFLIYPDRSQFPALVYGKVPATA